MLAGVSLHFFGIALVVIRRHVRPFEGSVDDLRSYTQKSSTQPDQCDSSIVCASSSKGLSDDASESGQPTSMVINCSAFSQVLCLS